VVAATHDPEYESNDATTRATVPRMRCAIIIMMMAARRGTTRTALSADHAAAGGGGRRRLSLSGSRRESHPPATTDPGVTISRLCRIRHNVEYAEARIMPSRWSLRLVKRLAVGWIFGIFLSGRSD
jgi:hypothetical protein